MKIIRKTTIKQVITKLSKEKIKSSFESRSLQLQQECKQLTFEMRKLQKKKGLSPEEVNRRFQKEIDRRQGQIKWIEFQMEQLEILPIGSEITENEMDAIIEVQPGDKWDEVAFERAIIVKDGIVIRIE